jgi:hypothetical protein
MKRWLPHLFAAVLGVIAPAVEAEANQGGPFRLMWTQ